MSAKKYIRYKDTLITPVDIAWWRSRVWRRLRWLIALIAPVLLLGVFRNRLQSILDFSLDWMRSNHELTQTWTAVGSLTVAVGALILTVYELRSSRHHWRRMARPHLVVDLNYSPGQLVQIAISNKGIGPAKLIEVLVDTGGSLHPHFGGWYRFLLATSLLERTDELSFSFEEPAIPLFLHPGQSVVLADVRIRQAPNGETNGRTPFEQIWNQVRRATLLFKYEDLFDDCYMGRSELGNHLWSPGASNEGESASLPPQS